MNEKPILFSSEMVRAILEGRKTQTRRVLSYQPDADAEVYGPEMYEPAVVGRDGELEPGKAVFGIYGDEWSVKCPYGQPGDRLWVREAFAYAPNERYVYKANYMPPMHESEVVDLATGNIISLVWRPSIHMPRKASRLTLEIVNVRVERVQNISKDDILAEGINGHFAPRRKDPLPTPRSAFAQLWDTINKDRGFGWDVNPWVWVIEFKKVAYGV